MELYCKKCKYRIHSRALQESKYIDVQYGDGQELLPAWEYVRTDKANYNFDFPIKYLVHSKSLLLIDHEDSLRFQGCCGPSQFGELNQVCPQCKNEIGILVADCWTSHFIGIDETKVTLQPIW
ncbi:hypothetical protein [Aquimarina pacifica]|uniref:hypothetical protein n=1 Tax=Aquimarina pacifica TaxID=1296415 RepID=UPI00046EE854|nr:hypothetical protein [Aquimarina pacifica]